MRETLRLAPTAPNRTVSPLEDTTLKGKYYVEKGTLIYMNIYNMHRDPKVWGEDVCNILSSCEYNGLQLPDRPKPSAPSVCWATSSTSSRYAPIVTSTARMPDF